MADSKDGSQAHVWAFSKKEKGWYMARWVPDAAYADELRSSGYAVEISVQKPTGTPVAA